MANGELTRGLKRACPHVSLDKGERRTREVWGAAHLAEEYDACLRECS
jgi:hypothetical protein